MITKQATSTSGALHIRLVQSPPTPFSDTRARAHTPHTHFLYSLPRLIYIYVCVCVRARVCIYIYIYKGNKTVPDKVATTCIEDGHRLPKQALQYKPKGRRNIG